MALYTFGVVANGFAWNIQRLPLVLGSVVLSVSFMYFYLLHDMKLQSSLASW